MRGKQILPPASDIAMVSAPVGAVDAGASWARELAMAEAEGEALALERLAAARAGVEGVAAGVVVAPGQLRVVVGE